MCGLGVMWLKCGESVCECVNDVCDVCVRMCENVCVNVCECGMCENVYVNVCVNVCVCECVCVMWWGCGKLTMIILFFFQLFNI